MKTIAVRSSHDLGIPRDSWDSHVHVIDEGRFAFQPDAHYLARDATLDDLVEFERGLGVQNFCLVSVSIYGNDNQSIYDTLRRLKGRGRAVVSFDPAVVTEKEPDEMHSLGVRGVRLNLKTREESPTRSTLASMIQAYANRLRKRDWVLQLYLGLGQLPFLSDIVPTLGICVVLDHMASRDSSQPASNQPGYRELMELFRKQLIWIKISGTYRFNSLPDLDDFGRQLVKIGPHNVVWASDWPHTGGPESLENGRKIGKYRKVDDEAFVDTCYRWCDFDLDQIRRLFVDNPQRLWRVRDTSQSTSRATL